MVAVPGQISFHEKARLLSETPQQGDLAESSTFFPAMVQLIASFCMMLDDLTNHADSCTILHYHWIRTSTWDG